MISRFEPHAKLTQQVRDEYNSPSFNGDHLTIADRIREDVETHAHQYRGFSVPHEPFDFALLETLTVGHYRRVIHSFLSRFGSTIEKHFDGVLPLLREWLQGSTDFDVVWDP